MPAYQNLLNGVAVLVVIGVTVASGKLLLGIIAVLQLRILAALLDLQKLLRESAGR